MNSPVDPYQSNDSGFQGSIAEKPSAVKKVAKGCLYVFAVFILGVIALVIWVLGEQSEYESTAVPYIEKLIPKIATWDPNVVWDHYDQEVKSSISKEDNEKVVRFMSKLGELESTDTPEFQMVSTSASTSSGARKLVTYKIAARFESGDASIELTLVDRDGEFSVYHFKINSMVFVEDNGSTAEIE